jgi:hypothetical protein
LFGWNESVSLGSARASRAVFGALAEHFLVPAIENIAFRLTTTGHRWGADGGTRGRVRSPE